MAEHFFDVFHDLVATIGEALDVRDVFQRLGAIVARIIAHDEAVLALLAEDGSESRVYATTHEGEPERMCPHDPAMGDPSTPRLFDGRFCGDRGFRSGLRVPVKADGRVVGVFALLSRKEEAYSDRELILAERVAEYLAIALSHDRLSESARRAAVERDRAANLDASVELLHEIATVLDIRTVFPRVSEIANRVLPHDRMTMSFDQGRGEIIMQASSNDDFTHADRIRLHDHHVDQGPGGALILQDLQREPLPIAEPRNLQERLIAAGYRSFLAVNASAREQALGVEFWSKQVAAFSQEDVPTALRIAGHVALAVSHEQLAEVARHGAETRVRAHRRERRVKSLADEEGVRTGVGQAVGRSAEWKHVLKNLARVAPVDTTVLITGESGTGKEVVARLIHRASARSDGPFIALNCAALPEQLLESELFGHERGAFTDAQASKPGQIELASGGVLFLDEVGEMSLSAQAKFLRVIQEREFQRLGGTRTEKANVRVIAASNRDLRQAVDRGAFRDDLYYRIQVFEVHIPPLRDRRADILPLSEAFLQDISRSIGRPSAGLTSDAKAALLQHVWPGNVRELRNALERAAIISEGEPITAQDLSLERVQPRPVSATSDLNVVERETIAKVMHDSGWNKAQAARRLGLSRTQLYVRLRKYDLDGPPGVSVPRG
jgi:transcriptional regulator with GAF, ATPase, and Fis domain